MDNSPTDRTERCSCLTRSTPGSAATPPARSASSCANSPGAARSYASPTCPRWPRWPRAISRSSRTTPCRPRAPRSPRLTAIASSESSFGCSEPARATAPPASTRASCCARRDQSARGRALVRRRRSARRRSGFWEVSARRAGVGGRASAPARCRGDRSARPGAEPGRAGAVAGDRSARRRIGRGGPLVRAAWRASPAGETSRRGALVRPRRSGGWMRKAVYLIAFSSSARGDPV